MQPRLRELTLKSAEQLEELGHRVDYVETLPVSSRVTDDFRLYWALMAKWQVTIIERAYGDTFDASRLSNLTLGLDRARPPQQAPPPTGDPASARSPAAHRAVFRHV